MRRNTQKKLAECGKTGAGAVQLSTLDDIVADCIGRDEPHMTGHRLEDSAHFGPGMTLPLSPGAKSVSLIATSDEENASLPSLFGPEKDSKKKVYKKPEPKLKRKNIDALWADNEYKAMKKRKLELEMMLLEAQITYYNFQNDKHRQAGNN